MIEVCYYVADDGKKFDDRWECQQYERQKQLEECKDEFQFFYCDKEPIADLNTATTENVGFIIIKTKRAAEVIGKWFEDDCCSDPFDGVYDECVGTWVWGEIIEQGDEWIKLELAVEQLQTLIAEINK